MKKAIKRIIVIISCIGIFVLVIVISTDILQFIEKSMFTNQIQRNNANLAKKIEERQAQRDYLNQKQEDLENLEKFLPVIVIYYINVDFKFGDEVLFEAPTIVACATTDCFSKTSLSFQEIENFRSWLDTPGNDKVQTETLMNILQIIKFEYPKLNQVFMMILWLEGEIYLSEFLPLNMPQLDELA